MNQEIFEAIKKRIFRLGKDKHINFRFCGNDLAKTIAEAVPELETKFLTKHNLKYQLGFCKGRVSFYKQLLKNLREKERTKQKADVHALVNCLNKKESLGQLCVFCNWCKRWKE